MKIELPFGAFGYVLELASADVEVLRARDLPPPPDIDELVATALDRPIRSDILDHVRPGARVTVIVSDSTRQEPRAAFLDALVRRLPDVRWTLAIATGTHGPTDVDALDLPAAWRGREIINH